MESVSLLSKIRSEYLAKLAPLNLTRMCDFSISETPCVHPAIREYQHRLSLSQHVNDRKMALRAGVRTRGEDYISLLDGRASFYFP